ncbi:ryncolin-4-like [Antedon mediterranea]|uniref:ryncolin-4-like n=1 Tax=Antedon mediterranea TaxID=105859 RepID=UPI003AF99162
MFVRSIILSLMVALVVSSSHTVDRDDCHVSVVVNDCEKHARDCTDILDRDSQTQSGEYTIDPHDGGKPIRVYCDMVTDGGGWTVFQRREDGSMDFYRNWEAYKTGFGSISSEHWLGNDNIYRITSAGHFELRIDMTTFDNESAYARYGTFRIGNEGTNYKLMIGTYTGDAGDSLSFHNNQQFSTSDRDNDKSCAVTYKGGWWYAKCHASNLNGLYLGGNTKQYATGVVWKTWKTYYYSLKTTEMKIRRLKYLNNIQLVKMFVRSIILSLMVALVVSSSHTVDRDDCHVSVVVNDCEKHARDCTDILDRDSQTQSGEYTIDPHDGGKPIRVYCDMVTDGGGWTVFQRREDGSMDFYRNWEAYKTGFGSISSEHWFGNDNIYRITSVGHFELRVDMTTFDNESAYARYGTFRIGNEGTNYKLMIGTYTGDAGT